MERWQKTNPLSTLEFQDSHGDVEFSTDGGKHVSVIAAHGFAG